MSIFNHTYLKAAWLVGVLILLNTTIAVTPAYAATINFTADIGVNPIIGEGTTIADGVSVGDNADVGTNVTVSKDSTIGNDVSIGDNSEIAKDVVIGDSVTTGENVTIAKGAQIGDGVEIGDNTLIKKNVIIGDNVVLGAGVSIGKNAIIAADSVVPDGTVIPNGGTYDSTSPITITGMAEAPNGVIAQFETSKPILLATIDFIFPAAGAAITGLQPVGGATVELIRIDNDGNQVGSVLASTVTSISGNYSLALPTGVSLAGDLVVRISGTTASMSAMVVDQTVNINPISQFVLDKFVDVPNLILADLAINEVVSLSGKVEEFDLTATADLSTMLAQLEAEVGQFVDLEIAAIDATPDDGTASAAVAGNWHFIEFELGMEDSDDSQFASFSIGIFAEAGSSIIDDGNGDLSLGSGLTLIEAFTDFAIIAPANRVFGYGIDINVAGDPELTPAVIDADSNISVSFPFEESFDDAGPGGPDFGTRSPPGNFFLNAVANGNTYVFNSVEAEVGYGTIDTNNDGIKDALNPADRKGDLLGALLGISLKQGSGMTAASLNGNFGSVTLAAFLDTSQGIFESIVGESNLNNGTVTVLNNAQDTRQVIRTPVTLNNVTLTDNVVPEGPETHPYTVSPSGQVTLDFAGDSSDVLEGFTNDDGSVIAFVGSEATGNPIITDVANAMQISVKLGTNMASSLNGATYQLLALAYVLRTDGYSNIHTLGHGTVGVFNADATTFSINGTDRGFSRNTDLSQIIPLADPINDPDFVLAVDSIAANGVIAMSLTDGTGTDTLEGFVSADSNLLILRALGTDIGERNIGLVIGIKQ